MLAIKGILWGEMPQIIDQENPRKQIQSSQNNAFTVIPLDGHLTNQINAYNKSDLLK